MRRSLRLPVIAAAAVLILLALDTGAWWLLTSRLQAEAAAWQQDRIAAGYTVTAGTPIRGGWPFRAVLTLPDVLVATASPGTADAVTWRTGEVRLVYAPWRPAEASVVLDGAQTLQFAAAPAITVQVENLDLVVPLGTLGQANGFVAQGRHLQVPLPTGRLGIDSLWLELAPAAFHVSLSSMTLPDPGLPLGVTVNVLELQAHSTTPLPEERNPATAAAAWRDAGGQLVVSEATLEWGPLDIHGTASLGLDRALQPVGSGTVHVTGYAQAADAMARSGIMTRNNAKVATTLLGLMSHPGDNGVPQADLPFMIHDGLVMAGAIPLMRLPAVAWP